jgi:acyl carrier protein
VTDARVLVDELRRIVTEVVGGARAPAEVDRDTPLGEGGFWLDSVELLEVIVACEEKFAITFEPGEDLIGPKLSCLGTLAEVIRGRIASSACVGAVPTGSPTEAPSPASS